MKKIIFIIIFLFLYVSSAYSDWYIFNTENRCIARTSYKPDAADLETRNEFTVFDSVNIPILEAEYQGGKVKVRVKSQAEKNAEKEAEDERLEMADVYHIMFREAAKISYKEGKSIDKLGNHVDNVQDEKDKVGKKKTDFEAAKVKLMALGLTGDEAESLR